MISSPRRKQLTESSGVLDIGCPIVVKRTLPKVQTQLELQRMISRWNDNYLREVRSYDDNDGTFDEFLSSLVHSLLWNRETIQSLVLTCLMHWDQLVLFSNAVFFLLSPWQVGIRSFCSVRHPICSLSSTNLKQTFRTTGDTPIEEAQTWS